MNEELRTHRRPYETTAVKALDEQVSIFIEPFLVVVNGIPPWCDLTAEDS